ncbi:unnamed protein product [Eretmochelys imbricata]
MDGAVAQCHGEVPVPGDGGHLGSLAAVPGGEEGPQRLPARPECCHLVQLPQGHVQMAPVVGADSPRLAPLLARLRQQLPTAVKRHPAAPVPVRGASPERIHASSSCIGKQSSARWVAIPPCHRPQGLLGRVCRVPWACAAPGGGFLCPFVPWASDSIASCSSPAMSVAGERPCVCGERPCVLGGTVCVGKERVSAGYKFRELLEATSPEAGGGGQPQRQPPLPSLDQHSSLSLSLSHTHTHTHIAACLALC